MGYHWHGRMTTPVYGDAAGRIWEILSAIAIMTIAEQPISPLALPHPFRLAQLRGLEGVTLHNPLEINAATSKVGTTNSLAGVHDPERKSWVAVAPATPA